MQIGVDFCPVKETNRTHSCPLCGGSRAKSGQKRCAKMMALNLSVLPLQRTLVVLSF
nr:secretion protein HlyD [Centipeda periodontii]